MRFGLCVVLAIAAVRLKLEGGTNVHQASQTSPQYVGRLLRRHFVPSTLNLTETNVQFIELSSYGSLVFPMRGERRYFMDT